MKIVLGTAIALLMAIGAVNAADCSKEIATVVKGKLTVAGGEYPPFTMATQSGELEGIDADIMKRVAEDNCLEFSPLVMDAGATIQAVTSGKADVAIGSWNRTAKRMQVLGISAPMYVDPMALFSKAGYESIDDLVGKNVGTVQGYFWVPDLQKLMGTSLKLYPSAVALAQDLETGRIDIGVDGYNSGAYIQKKQNGYPGIVIKLAKPDERIQASVLPGQTGVLYTKGNTSLGEALDESINKQRADGTILKALQSAGFDEKVADTGEPRLIQ